MRNPLKTYRKYIPDQHTQAMLINLLRVMDYVHKHLVHLHGWHFAWTWIAS